MTVATCNELYDSYYYRADYALLDKGHIFLIPLIEGAYDKEA